MAQRVDAKDARLTIDGVTVQLDAVKVFQAPEPEFYFDTQPDPVPIAATAPPRVDPLNEHARLIAAVDRLLAGG